MIYLILLLLLTGCSSMSIIRDKDGRVDKVIGIGNIEASVKQGDEEVSVSTKPELLKDVVNLQLLREG